MNEWEKAKDIKPEYNKEVLVYTDDQEFYLAYWSNNKMWYDLGEGRYMRDIYGEVLYWMELPALPAEEERKTKC